MDKPEPKKKDDEVEPFSQPEPPETSAQPKKPTDDTEFRIRDFPDIRDLRKTYLNREGKSIEVDSNNTPRLDGSEPDLGLERSSDEDAWKFYCDTLAESLPDKACGDRDALMEFLDDQ